MNSQNRMNAGAEYVLYRIWGALQDEKGIHAESLLTCVGALAGYACQVYVRQTATLPGVDPAKYSLLTVNASDGTKHLSGDALLVPLVDSPLSVWALVSRAVQKLDEPLPDLQDILTHVTQTAGTSAFGVSRAPEGHRPRHPATFYLEQLWPQVLPIAQRFCRKPMQVPVLFGIALQRAIEHTKDRLSPTLGASIAMDCAVAMARVALPETFANATVAQPLGTQRMRIAMPANGQSLESAPVRATSPRRRRRADAIEARVAGVRALVARLPPAAPIVTIASLAFITMAGAMYEGNGRQARETVREVREFAVPQMRAGMPVLAQATEDPRFADEPPSAQEPQYSEAQFSEERQFAEVDPGEPYEAPQDFTEGLMGDDPPLEPDPGSDGSAEIVMRDDL